MIPILAHEIRESVRSRWFLGVTAVFCMLALGVSYLSFSGAGALGFAGFSRTVAGLLNLMLLFMPLMGILVGALGFAGEREDGTLGYLLAQPVGRGAVYAGKFAGRAASLVFSTGFGLGLAGLVVGGNAGAAGARAFGMLALAAVLLGAASLGAGTLVGVLSGSRMRALVGGLLLWVLFAFVLDAAEIALVVSGLAGPKSLFYLSFLNPVQLAKVLCLLSVTAKLETLGPSGIYAVKAFGTTGALLLAGAALAAWAALSAAIGWLFFRRMNVR